MLGKKYHVNPETGRPNLCSARTSSSCLYAHDGVVPEHYDTKEQARAGYEESMKDATFVVEKSIAPKKKLAQTVLEAKEPMVRNFKIDAWNVGKLESEIRRLNRSLERSNADGRFEITTDIKDELVNIDGKEYLVPVANVTIVKPVVAKGGKKFLARIEEISDGNFVVHSLPGSDLDGWRPSSMECEVCHKSRHRQKVYLVEDENGHRKTVGGQCIEIFTGMNPKGLMAMEWDFAKNLEEDGVNEDYFRRRATEGAQAYPKEEILALAYVISQRDGGFRGKAFEDFSTVSQIEDFISDRKKSSEDLEYEEKLLYEVSKVDKKELVSQINETLSRAEQNDWSKNVEALMTAENVSRRNLGTLVSAMALVVDRKKREKIEWSKGYLGSPGEKVENVKAEVVQRKTVEQNFGRYPTYAEMVTLRTEDGHRVVVFTSSKSVPREGDVVSFSAVVKKNSEYNGVDSTQISRPKWIFESEETQQKSFDRDV